MRKQKIKNRLRNSRAVKSNCRQWININIYTHTHPTQEENIFTLLIFTQSWRKGICSFKLSSDLNKLHNAEKLGVKKLFFQKL